MRRTKLSETFVVCLSQVRLNKFGSTNTFYSSDWFDSSLVQLSEPKDELN